MSRENVELGETLARVEYALEPVRNPSEEAACDQCGAPRYVGDDILWLDTGDAFCGKPCARKAGHAFAEDRDGGPFPTYGEGEP